MQMTTPAARVVGAETKRRLYTEMLRIRIVDERIAELYAEQQMRCPVHLSVGQEGICAGVCVALGPQDYVFSGHRAHGHYLARGGNVRAMMAELYGRVTGCCEGKGGSMHLVDPSVGFLGAVPIVGSTLPIAVGAAHGSKMKGEDRVTVAFFGEGATEEGVFHESMNFATLHKLPVLFLCENNFYSVYSPLAVRQPEGRKRTEQARAYGMPADAGDGNDPVEVYEKTRAAVDAVRGGAGPMFLEFETYRWREHCGPNYDDHLGYRDPAVVDAWKRRDPVPAMEARLLGERVCTQAELDAIAAEIKAQCEDAVAFAKSSPFPGPEALWQHLYP